jgi:hypothetical protein
MNEPKSLEMRTFDLAERNAMFPNAVTETGDENGAVIRAIDAAILAQEINSPTMIRKVL